MKLAERLVCLALVAFLTTGGNAFAFTAQVPPVNKRVVKASLVPPPADTRAPSARARTAFADFERSFSGAQGVEWATDSDSPKALWGFRSGRVAGKADVVGKAFLSNNETLLGTDGSDLGTVKVLERRGFRHVRFQQIAAGAPVEGAFVSVHMDRLGRVVAAESTYRTNMKVDTAMNVTEAQAKRAVRASLPPKAKPGPSELVVNPAGKGKGSFALRTVTTSRKPYGVWVTLVDARTGKVVSKRTALRSGNTLTESNNPNKTKAVSAPLAAAAPRGAWSTVYSNGFDSGSWPSAGWRLEGWRYYGGNWVSGPRWGRTGYKKFSGGYSLWPAMSGPGAVSPSSLLGYPNDISSWAMYGPFNLSNASAAKIGFKLLMNTEGGFDWLSYSAGTIGKFPDAYPNAGYHYSGWRTSGVSGTGSSPAWISETGHDDSSGYTNAPGVAINLGDWNQMGDFGPVLGDSAVYFVLGFDSDDSVNRQGESIAGPFVDSVTIQKYVQAKVTGTTNGYMKGYVYPTTGAGVRALAAMKNQWVLVGPYRVMTGSPGTYTASSKGAVQAWLRGPYCAAVNEDVANVVQKGTSYSNFNHVWNYASTDTHADEVNLFYHVNRAHTYYKDILGFGGMDYAMRAIAHLGSSENNAYYNSITGFIQFGDGDGVSMRDTARGDDVIYHEYTHGAADHIVDLPYQLESGAMAEGYADYFAGSFTNDPIMGQYVFADPAECRDMEQDGAGHSPGHEMRYDNRAVRNGGDAEPAADWWTITELPDDANDGGWVHHNSSIFSGALWDLRNSMIAHHGATNGKVHADKIILESMFFWPDDLRSSVRAMYMADQMLFGSVTPGSSNANSPHKSLIDAAAARHGFQRDSMTTLASNTTIGRSPASPTHRKPMTINGYVSPAVVGANEWGQNAQGAKVRVQVWLGSTLKATIWTRLRYSSNSRSYYAVAYTPSVISSAWSAKAYFPGAMRTLDGYRLNVSPSLSPRMTFRAN